MASISQRGTNWRVLWRLGGTRDGRQQSLTFISRKAAVHAKEIAEAHRHNIVAKAVQAAVLGIEYDPNKPAPAQTPTVKEWADTWLNSRTQIGPGTRVDYRRKLDQVILPALDGRHLHEVTGSDIAAIITGLQARVASATVDRYYVVLHSMFRYAVTERLLDDNPVRRIGYKTGQIETADDDEVDRVRLTMWEFDRIVACARPDDRPLIEFLAATGCRWGEATAVRVGAIDLAAATVRIYRAWTYDRRGGWSTGPTKGRNKRTLPLPLSMVELLRPLVVGRAAAALVFQGPGADPAVVGDEAERRARLDNRYFLAHRWDPAIVAAMRCPDHPPPPRGKQIPWAPGKANRCGFYGGVNSDDKPCGRWTARGWDRCAGHVGPEEGAVSTCNCRRLTRRPTPHDLRHSHVEWMRVAGIPMSAISRQVGHRTEKITDVVYSGSDVDPRVAQMFDALRRTVRDGGPNVGGGAAGAE